MRQTLGERLKELRENLHLSQKVAASHFGITNFQLSRYETGKANPDPELIAEFAKFYEVSSDYLLGLSSVKNPRKRSENPFLNDLSQVSKEDLEELEEYFQLMQRRKKKHISKLD